MSHFIPRFPDRCFVVRRALVVLALNIGLTPSSLHAQSPVTEGLWETLPYLMPINPIHCGLTHTGKVLVVAGSENDPAEDEYYAAVWNPATGTIAVQELLWDVFCNGMVALPDGRFIVVGGTEDYDPFRGESYATIYDPLTEKFNEVEAMAHGRWYATATNLGDGRLMVFSGTDENGNTNTAVEIYKIGSGWGPEYYAPWSPPLYPRLHLLPNGDVFYSAENINSSIYHPFDQSWSLNVATTVYQGNRWSGSVVLLPLRPAEGYAARLLTIGGNDPATGTAEIIDLSVPSPAWRAIASMSQPRVQMNAVILPTGKVLALGGSARNENPDTASLAADLFDPATETWAPAGAELFPRLYHSVALLLPDATVWVAGSNPIRGAYEEHMEIYRPAYLFTTDDDDEVIPAPRPAISSVPSEIGYAAPIKIRTPDAAEIGSVVLVRPGAVTHSFDMEQRLIELSFQPGPGNLRATAPPNGFIAPPGYYMLFLINRAGVPSLAKFVHLTSTPANKPPDGKIKKPAATIMIHAGESVNFAGSARDPDGSISTYSWVFPGGTPETSSARVPGPVTFTEEGTHVVSMTAIDNAGVNDPSPPTCSVIVEPAP